MSSKPEKDLDEQMALLIRSSFDTDVEKVDAVKQLLIKTLPYAYKRASLATSMQVSIEKHIEKLHEDRMILEYEMRLAGMDPDLIVRADSPSSRRDVQVPIVNTDATQRLGRSKRRRTRGQSAKPDLHDRPEKALGHHTKKHRKRSHRNDPTKRRAADTSAHSFANDDSTEHDEADGENDASQASNNEETAQAAKHSASNLRKRERREPSVGKVYCICATEFKDSGEPLSIACSNGRCPYGWFHASCLGLEGEGLNEVLKSKEAWYCSECDEKASRRRGKHHAERG